MPFPPALTTDESNSAFVGTFEANLASGNAPALGDDFPASWASWSGTTGEADLPSAGTHFAGIELPATAGAYLGGILGFVGGIGGADTVLPAPPLPDYGPIRPNQGALATAFPPALGTEEANAQFVGTFEGYLVALAEAMETLPSFGGQIPADLAPGSLGQNQQNDPAGSQAQLDGQFDVFVGEVQPAFSTTRLPRLAFGPFLNLAGLTYQIELDAFAKFGLTQVQYRIYANDQATPPYNVINLGGQTSFTTSLILTLDSPAATLHADAVLTDAFGNVAAQPVSLPGVPDTSPPTAPPFLYVVQTSDGTWLFVWGAATDDFVVDHYQIDQVDQSGNLVATLAGGIKQDYFLSRGAVAGNYYRVLAFDLAGNISPSSPIVQAIAASVQPVVITISEVMAQQVPGTESISVSWVVTPAGTSCTAVIVDALDHPIGTPVTTAAAQATLTAPAGTSPALFRVKVTAA